MSTRAIMKLRQELHRRGRLEFMASPTKNLLELIFFIDPSLEWNPKTKSKIRTFRPTHLEQGDISSNVPHFIKASEFYVTIDEFIDVLRIFVPCDRIEVVNGFLNLYYHEEALLDNLSSIEESYQSK